MFRSKSYRNGLTAILLILTGCRSPSIVDGIDRYQIGQFSITYSSFHPKKLLDNIEKTINEFEKREGIIDRPGSIIVKDSLDYELGDNISIYGRFKPPNTIEIWCGDNEEIPACYHELGHFYLWNTPLKGDPKHESKKWDEWNHLSMPLYKVKK